MNFGLRGDIDDIMYCLKFHGAIVIGLALAKAQKSLFFTKMGIDRYIDRQTDRERECHMKMDFIVRALAGIP